MEDSLSFRDSVKQVLDIHDGGPIYAETLFAQPGEVVVEPFNAFSSILIALPAIYWFLKLRGEFKTHWFLTLMLPFLFLNGLGSTLFHATRSSNLLLIMDFAPAALLTLGLTIYLWAKVFRNWIFTTLTIIAMVVARYFAATQFGPPLSINIGYAVGGLGFLIPLVILLVRMQGKGAFLIFGALGALMIALFFRQADDWAAVRETIPIGTHFLWHAATGVAGFLLGQFLYNMRCWELENEELEESLRKQPRTNSGKVPLKMAGE